MRTCIIIAVMLGFAAIFFFASQAHIEYLKEEPASGQLPHGKIVYVDDGTCPIGEVKEITGGSQKKSIPRKVRCVRQPKLEES